MKFYGSKYKDVLVGTNFSDEIHGWNNDDVLRGGRGADILHGGYGQDIMYGGRGADTFVFTQANHSRVGAPDMIADFQRGIDTIVIPQAESVEIFARRIEVDVDGDRVVDMVIQTNTRVTYDDIIF